MPLQETSGAVSYDAFGGGAAAVPNYIEQVFQTWLYTGTGATRTITNGIDLSTKGGLVWIKDRTNGYRHNLFDTSQGATKLLHSDISSATVTDANSLTAFGATGFTLGSGNTSGNQVNTNTDDFVSWTFRKQPKFFDVVTYTGTGANRTVAHNLGSAPGCMIVKRTDDIGDWIVYNRGLDVLFPEAYYILLNDTGGRTGSTGAWNNTKPTSTVFTVGTNATVNANGGTYVAYLFAHNAGGFGLTGTDNVISCGSFTSSNSTDVSVSLGYEPQWLLLKDSNSSTNGWLLVDNMRSFSQTESSTLLPNSSQAENVYGASYLVPTATGFTSKPGFFANGNTVIYIAIRRGPMKTPTTGTSVFSPAYASTNTSPTKVTTGFPVDMQINSYLPGTGTNQAVLTRLQGVSSNTTESGVYLSTVSTAAESPSPAFSLGWDNTGFKQFSYYDGAKSGFWNFGRAPGFMDVVCYTGTGSAQNVTHNLNAVPELWIIKDRTSTENWQVGSTLLANTEKLVINTTAAKVTDTTAWNSTTPTAYVFTVGTQTAVNKGPGGFGPDNYVAHLFATCPGVSKVGSYTGNGSTQTINCGFTGGARFVLIKRTDSTGGWYVYDTARGMTTLTDPYLLLNSTAAESATLGSVTTVTTGFAVDASILAAVNTNAATYIFLAIA